MAAEIASVRPAVLSQETRHCLEEYRRFRHVVRNVYTFNLPSARLQELTDGLGGCYQAVARDLEEFFSFLDQLSAADGDG